MRWLIPVCLALVSSVAVIGWLSLACMSRKYQSPTASVIAASLR